MKGKQIRLYACFQELDECPLRSTSRLPQFYPSSLTSHNPSLWQYAIPSIYTEKAEYCRMDHEKEVEKQWEHVFDTLLHFGNCICSTSKGNFQSNESFVRMKKYMMIYVPLLGNLLK